MTAMHKALGQCLERSMWSVNVTNVIIINYASVRGSLFLTTNNT